MPLNLAAATQDELRRIWEAHDGEQFSVRQFTYIFHRLAAAEEPLPSLAITQLPFERRAANLLTNSNAKAEIVREHKVQIAFPKEGGYITGGRHEFVDQDDLLTYLSSLFPFAEQADCWRVAITRRGRYQRLSASGQPVFTFGDPVLDTVTSDSGLLILGGDVIDVRALRHAESTRPHGGVRSVEFGPRPQWIEQAVADAMLGRGNFYIDRHGTDLVMLSSRNPDTLHFYYPSKGDWMTFHAWKSSTGPFWSMGGEIETGWHDFVYAAIVSDYSFIGIVGNCASFSDSDDDTYDDYVDELEWGVGHPHKMVTAHCKAKWWGQYCTGTVSKGSCP